MCKHAFCRVLNRQFKIIEWQLLTMFYWNPYVGTKITLFIVNGFWIAGMSTLMGNGICRRKTLLTWMSANVDGINQTVNIKVYIWDIYQQCYNVYYRLGAIFFCGLLGNGRKIRRKKELQLPDETEGASNTTICILEDNRFYWIYCLRSLLNAKNKKREGRKTQLKGDFLSCCCFNQQKKKRLYSRKKEVEKNVFYFSVNF